MSALGFEVHIDKENATPAPFAHKGSSVKSFGLQRDKGKLVQPTPRKALFDVNHEPANVASRNVGLKELGSSSNVSRDGWAKPMKSAAPMSTGIENAPMGTQIKKPDLKKTPSVQKKGSKVLKDSSSCASKARPSTKPKKSLQPKPDPAPVAYEEDYDSDTIFPRAERLSSYVDKLLAWRPPCLFGTIPDSESDASEPEDMPEEEIVRDIPFCLTSVPEFSELELANLMGDLPPPPPSPEEKDHKSGDANEVKSSTELSLDQSADTSLSFGSLHVMHGSLDVSLATTLSDPETSEN